MSRLICVMGESGSGKTTSMRNLDPNTTFYIDCDKKGLCWKGWKDQYNISNGNYAKTDNQQTVLSLMKKINGTGNSTGIQEEIPIGKDGKKMDLSRFNVIVIDTLNGIMVADEMRRMGEKGYDKWIDLAAAVYGIVDFALTMKDSITVIVTCHTQTDHDENGYMFTRVKTSGKKLDKIVLESKFTTVLLSKCVDGKYLFETQSNNSTAKSPMGALPNPMDNDIVQVLEALKDY